MNLNGLRERTRMRVGVATGDRFIDTPVLTMAVNDGLRLLDSEHDWPWLEKSALLDLDTGVGEMLLPTDCRDVRSVLAERPNSSPPAWEELTEVAPVDALQAYTSGSGRVVSYGMFEGKLWLYPPSSQPIRLTLLYYRLSPVLVDDADEPLVPEQYQDAVVSAAAAMLASREDDRSSQSAHLADYQGWVVRMRSKVSRRSKPIVPRIRPGGWLDSVG